jgi:hypothetical protein
MVAIELFPSLAGKQSKLGGAASWLAGLLKSFESKRADAHEKAKVWLEHVTDLAHAELLDAEPALHAALGDAVGAELEALVARQIDWLALEVQTAHEAVAAQRAALAPLAARRDRAELDRAELATELERIEAELPAAAAAAAAAVAA